MAIVPLCKDKTTRCSEWQKKKVSDEQNPSAGNKPSLLMGGAGRSEVF
jgi:hypothetical protein